MKMALTLHHVPALCITLDKITRIYTYMHTYIYRVGLAHTQDIIIAKPPQGIVQKWLSVDVDGSYVGVVCTCIDVEGVCVCVMC